MLDLPLVALFVRVCKLDMQAIKPGNVGLHGAGHGMRVADFVRSARACAPAICRPGIPLGERILGAIQATRTVVDCNTNLGIVLLCAPLIQAALDARGQDLRLALERVLSAATIEDAALVYRAIRLAAPGGMGRVAQADLAQRPTIRLREAMALARERDLVAAQYADGYRLVFDTVVPRLLEFQLQWGYAKWAAVGAYLALLGKHPDSLVARRHGVEKAQMLSAEAALLYNAFAATSQPEAFRLRLLAFDRRLKLQGINPGTTADLVITGLLIAGLKALDQVERNPPQKKGA